MTKKKLVYMLKDLGLSVSLGDLFAAPHVASIYCQNKGCKKNSAVPGREMEEGFSGFPLVDYNPDAIVLGLWVPGLHLI